METLGLTVLATTTFAKYDSNYETVRADLTLSTLTRAKEYGYKVVAVDGGSPRRYLQDMLESGAYVFTQEVNGMGNARRQALRTAREMSNSGAIVWLEPEKCNLVPLIGPAISKVIDENYDLVMFSRLSLDSYPEEQKYTYAVGRLIFRYLTGLDCDFFFGPTVLSSRGVDSFLDYNGEYGDLWDSIHIPKWRLIRDGLPWTQMEIDYQHPEVQKEAETGNLDLFMKRIQQEDLLTRALIHDIRGSEARIILPGSEGNYSFI